MHQNLVAQSTRSGRDASLEASAAPQRAAPLNLARLDLVTMHMVVLCIDLGSLSATAKQLHCSLSACSHRLSALEATLGRSLFVRDRVGLSPTHAGELFAEHARKVLHQIDAMRISMLCERAPLPS